MTPITREEALKKIAELVERFEQNYESYKNASYNETQVRREFIDPLFKALGWDIDNEQGIAEAYKEVIHEDRVKVDNETKAPDYCFTVYGQKKFFVEAKKPSIKIKEEIPPAYQVRRYGWSAKLAVSIVTDFEEFAVYDCTKKPALTDKASVARIEYFTFRDYASKFDFLWDTFSKEGVLKGNLDRYLASDSTKKGTTAVDREFLKSMDEWRVELASNIALRNGLLSESDINHAVQLIIDRLIFLRICEDREIESYGAIRDASGKSGCYKGLSAVFIAADQKYNSGLFNFEKDTLTPSLVIDDKTIKKIIDEMYYPASPFHFAAMPVEILGNAYEQFLGKTITFKRKTKDGHSVEIEEKPEVRKAGGVYYTPQYIVEYIVKHTVGELLAKDGMTPEKASAIRILDPACGSGSFLLGAYQFLLDWHLEYYRTHDGKKKGKSSVLTPDGRLATHEKKRILLNNLYGVDIDAQAVEVTKLSLLLKCLEGETNASITEQVTLLHERVLPTLDANIKCGNSLIGPDYFTGKLIPDDEELRRVNPFDWKREFPAVFMPSSSGSFSQGEKEGKTAEGFDCVIGNPPYIRIQTMKEWAPLEVEIYKELYESASVGNYDIYVVFVEKALSLLNMNGLVGFILPHKFFNAQYGAPLRGVISKGQHLKHVVHFGDAQVFDGATTYTCLLFLGKQKTVYCDYIDGKDIVSWKENRDRIGGRIESATIDSNEWVFWIGNNGDLFRKLRLYPEKLADVADRIFQGIVTSSDNVYLLEPNNDKLVNEEYVDVKSAATGKNYHLEANVVWPLCKGSRDIRRYSAKSSKRVLFPYDAPRSCELGKTILITDKEFSQKYPNTWSYLNENYETLRNREKGKMQHEGWYGYVYPKSVSLFAKKKIITPSIANQSSFALDKNGELYFVGSGGGGGGGYGITLKDNVKISYEYLLGLLNSKLLDMYLKSYSSPFSGGYYAYNRQYIEQLPIRTIDFSIPAEKEKHDRMVSLVERMLDLHKKKADAKSPADVDRIERMIAATDDEIDALVYVLYGLTEEEIKIVEGK